MDGLLDGLNTSEKLRVVMAAKKKTNLDIANILGVTRETIGHRLESDKWFLKDLKKIAAELEIDEHVLTT